MPTYTETLSLSMVLKSGKPRVVYVDECDHQTERPELAAKKEICQDGLELNVIRKRLGQTLGGYAAALGISKGTLASYLYGVVQKIPAGVMARARSLVGQEVTPFQSMTARFDGLSMRQIVDAWFHELGQEKGSHTGTKVMCDVLTVDRATIWRWVERGMRPDDRALLAYQSLIDEAKASRTAQ
jgi:hypothetical protein